MLHISTGNERRLHSSWELSVNFSVTAVSPPRLDSPRQPVLRFVVAFVLNGEQDSVKVLVEGLHHLKNDILLIVLADSGPSRSVGNCPWLPRQIVP